MEEQRTCEERIGDMYKRTFSDLREAIEGRNRCEDCGHEWQEDDPIECPNCGSEDIEEAEPYGETWDRYTEGILDISKREVHYVLLSTGGPEDGIEIEVQNGEIVGASYVFKDWFDGAKRAITGDDLDLVIQAFEAYVI